VSDCVGAQLLARVNPPQDQTMKCSAVLKTEELKNLDMDIGVCLYSSPVTSVSIQVTN